MIAIGRQAKAMCEKCSFDAELDLDALRSRVGGDYCLIDRRSKCRICGGWVRFFYLQGIWRGMWTDEGSSRWISVDRKRNDR
jgi:hypothetical protein